MTRSLSRPPLTVGQLAAATSRAGVTYVRAGPGAGKTHLCAEAYGHSRYVRHSRETRGVVAVTFARSARRELKNRIRRYWGPGSLGLPNAVCTFDELHRRLLRYLVQEGLVHWPGGVLPGRVIDRWPPESKAKSSVAKGRKRCYAGFDAATSDVIILTENERTRRTPTPAFVDGEDLLQALETEFTHVDVRNVLEGLARSESPAHHKAAEAFFATSICHIIVDEAFDINRLDLWILKLAERAGVALTLVGDPWQSLYEFRDATPQRVRDFVERANVRRVDVPGEHRFDTPEMRQLVELLYDGKPFSVRPPEDGDSFDVVLAHDWADLWAETRIPVVPAEPPRLDSAIHTSCFILLLDAFIANKFERDVARATAAARRHGISIDESRARLAPLVQEISTSELSPAECWERLADEFRTDQSTKWNPPGVRAQECMTRLVDLIADPGGVCLGLTVHQAKGLEWEQVLLLERELTTSATRRNQLDQKYEQHRKTYVALTRARRYVRVLKPLNLAPRGVARVGIPHV